MHNHQPEQPASLADPHASGLAALLTPQLRHVQRHSQAAQPQTKCSNNPIGTALAAQPQHHQGLETVSAECRAQWISVGHLQLCSVA